LGWIAAGFFLGGVLGLKFSLALWVDVKFAIS